ncbi:MAG: CehA/McbA family metallohydrolase [Firmicutes bacterium]|nr:CehA/McbA family metallohydrolase [Bacillota bacterium]
MHVVTGNIHIHSTHSDGAGTIMEIAQAAARVGLDYIIITDHHTLKGLSDEGYLEGVLVLCGSEINRAHHHYLALGIKNEIAADDDNPQSVIDAVNKQGGVGIIAHPFEKGSPLVLDGITYPWHDWNVVGFAGIEVWNWSSQWRDGASNLCKGLYYAYLHPLGPITGPCPQALARFDKITRQRKITAIAGSDAHDWHINRGPIRRRIFPYGYLFKTANNGLLLQKPLSQDAGEAKEQILTALRAGRAFIVNHVVAEATAFSFTITSGDNEFSLGDTAPLTAQTKLNVCCPSAPRHHTHITIVKDGATWLEHKDNQCSIKVKESGTYRVEVRLKKKPWIFTNPIYVR